ncbi:MAG: redoxin family protein [Rhizobiales bacterium]|nr:redoxin family protein [Hyphomicrobiales bacterium]
MTTEPQKIAEPQKVIRWWHFALIGVMIMMFILFAAGLGRDTKFIPSPLVGKPAFDFDLKQLGKESNIKLSDYKGKIVILNFWASWCVTCREEHHVLLEAANALQPKGTVQFLGVNSKDTDKGAFGFMDKRGHFPYPSVIDRQGRMALEYGVYGMPETFFINKDGVIAAKHIGALTHKILADKLKQAEAVQ